MVDVDSLRAAVIFAHLLSELILHGKATANAAPTEQMQGSFHFTCSSSSACLFLVLVELSKEIGLTGIDAFRNLSEKSECFFACLLNFTVCSGTTVRVGRARIMSLLSQ